MRCVILAFIFVVVGGACQLVGYALSEVESSRLRRAAIALNDEAGTVEIGVQMSQGQRLSVSATVEGPIRELTTEERVAILERRVDALRTDVDGLPDTIKQNVRKDLDFTMHAVSGELHRLKQAVWRFASEARARSRLWWFSVVLAASGTLLEMAAAVLTLPR